MRTPGRRFFRSPALGYTILTLATGRYPLDPQTHDFYQHNAEQIARRYESAHGGPERLFPQIFRKGQTILDIGAGTGRSSAALLRLGLEVHAVEPVAALRELAVSYHPELAGRVFAGELPGLLPATGIERYDAILLSAVIMHIPDAELPDAAAAIRDRLVPGGTLHFAEMKKQCEARKAVYGGIDSIDDLRANLRDNCIPDSVLDMADDDYPRFLEDRRILMAAKIRNY